MTVVDVFRNAHVYTVSLTSKDEKDGYKVKKLTNADFHVTELAWSPDNKTIVFTHQLNAAIDVWPTTDLSTVPADSGAENYWLKIPGLTMSLCFRLTDNGFLIYPMVAIHGGRDEPMFM